MTYFQLILLCGSLSISLLSCLTIAIFLDRRSNGHAANWLYWGVIFAYISVPVTAHILINTGQPMFSKATGSLLTGLVLGLPLWLTMGAFFTLKLADRHFESKGKPKSEATQLAPLPMRPAEGTVQNRHARFGKKPLL